jgi:hypothetical protein
MASYFPWTAISSAPRETPETPIPTPPPTDSTDLQKDDANYAVSCVNRLSAKSYPHDCPPLNVQWYHAVDIPKRKPFTKIDDATKLGSAKTYTPFSEGDSTAIEAAFQKLAEKDEEKGKQGLRSRAASLTRGHKRTDSQVHDTIKVPVNEDYLFDVDVEKRELSPAYWLGPIYDVRRGTWFYAESSGLRPADENLATQLEEGYLKIKPWNFDPVTGVAPQPSSKPEEKEGDSSAEKVSTEDQPIDTMEAPVKVPVKAPDPSERSFRLFGPHQNSVVTYDDANTAYILTDGYMAFINSTLYQRFSGGAHYAGVKMVRGFIEDKKSAGPSSPTTATIPEGSTANESDDLKLAKTSSLDIPEVNGRSKHKSKKETPRQALQRKISHLVTGGLNAADQAEEVRKREEQEIQEDYAEDDVAHQGREIEHLILVTHGVGQRLGLRLESSTFIHDVNTFRKTLKSVYNDSADLQALNGDADNEIKNSRIQVLPICWRHLLDFPKHSLRHNRREYDMGEASNNEEEQYPSLDDISLEGIPAIRNIVTDLGLDVLFYQSPIYKPFVSKIILEECNRSYALFKQRNPSFKGKVSLLGHSLGSAVLFDILCIQRSDSVWPSSIRKFDDNMQLDFDVEDFYSFGSPIGLYQMLKGRIIASRPKKSNFRPAVTPFGPTVDPFSQATAFLDVTTSSPKCEQIFNIFHPTDPIAYRIEPLISSAMKDLPPQPLPYTKKGFFSAPANQPLGGVSARVATLWNSFSHGMVNSIINRTLGLTSEQQQRLSSPLPAASFPSEATSPSPPSSLSTPYQSLPSTAGTTPAGTHPPHLNLDAPLSVEDVKRLVAQSSASIETGNEGQNPPTLLSTGLETLFSGFQRAAQSVAGTPLDGPTEKAVRAEGERVKKEEEKVKGLNKNGRVDYSIQE